MLMLIMISCTQHTIYKTNTDVVSAPSVLMEECRAVDVEDGATTKDELLHKLSIAYISTLKNISSCNIRIRAANDYIVKVKNETIK